MDTRALQLLKNYIRQEITYEIKGHEFLMHRSDVDMNEARLDVEDTWRKFENRMLGLE